MTVLTFHDLYDWKLKRVYIKLHSHELLYEPETTSSLVLILHSHIYCKNIKVLYSTLIITFWSSDANCSSKDFNMVSKQPKFNSH